jgi:hypothetical protein
MTSRTALHQGTLRIAPMFHMHPCLVLLSAATCHKHVDRARTHMYSINASYEGHKCHWEPPSTRAHYELHRCPTCTHDLYCSHPPLATNMWTGHALICIVSIIIWRLHMTSRTAICQGTLRIELMLHMHPCPETVSATTCHKHVDRACTNMHSIYASYGGYKRHQELPSTKAH